VITLVTKYIASEAITAWGLYTNGNTALRLIAPNGVMLMVASVNVKGITTAEHEVLIKDYSENRGVTDSLIENGVVKVLRTMKVGPYKAKVDHCLILDKTL